jgi:hypothetical protein
MPQFAIYGFKLGWTRAIVGYKTVKYKLCYRKIGLAKYYRYGMMLVGETVARQFHLFSFPGALPGSPAAACLHKQGGSGPQPPENSRLKQTSPF